MKLESKVTKGVVLRNARDNTRGFTNGLTNGFTNGNGYRNGRKLKESRSHGKVLAVFVLAMLVLSVVAVLTWQNSNASVIKINSSTEMEIKYTPRGPIHINGNAEFTSANGVTGGSGTQSDPYIIEGWEIDANGGSYGIWIENTTAYFVIRNCNVYGATDWWNLPGGAGITLNNVTHGTLDSNKCNNSLCGIYLYRSSQYNNITNNNASGNSDIGIYLASSSNNNITNNNASGNKYGIYLWNSSNNNITNNNASGNSWAGIRLSSSSNNNITNNNASGNSDTGIYLWDSSNNNNITNNNASGNSWDGIRLWWSSTNNTITNNNASGNRYGIYLWNSSNNNNITYNWICNNANYGVYITGSTGNTIHHNNFIANNGAGKGVSGNCQAYDSVGGNYWYDNSVNEGNYWSNWDSNGNGTANAYPIDGGAGASDWYPLGNPVAEFSSMPLFVLALASLLILARVRKPRKHS